MISQYRCETCKFADNNDESNKIFGLKYCSKCDLTIEPIFIDQICLTGCASHSDFQNERKKSCLWKEYEEYDLWETNCGNDFQFIEGDIEENNFKFCPYCGGKIAELRQGE